MRRVIVFCALAVLCTVPALGAELAVPELDRIWEQAEGYGVTQGEPLDDGLSGLLTGALGPVGLLFRPRLSAGV